MTIYVVEGSTGEYEDYSEWILCAYYDEALAKEHARPAIEAYRTRADRNGAFGIVTRQVASNPYDPDMHVDYTGVEYIYYPLEVLDALRPPVVEKEENDG